MIAAYKRYKEQKEEKKRQIELDRPLSILDVSYFFLDISKKSILESPYYKKSLYNFVPHYGLNRQKLNILCYHTYCWHLAFTGERMFDADFYASYSSIPFENKLKNKYKRYGWYGIPYGDDFSKLSRLRDYSDELSDFKGYTYMQSPAILDKFHKEKCSEFQLSLLYKVWGHYGIHESAVLRNYMWSDVPFRTALEENSRNISDADIMEYYKGNLIKASMKKGL